MCNIIQEIQAFIPMPLNDTAYLNAFTGPLVCQKASWISWVQDIWGRRKRRQGEDGERQLCNWLTLEGLAQVQIARPWCCKLQTFVSPQVESFFQTLSLLHIWVQFSACPLSENQFLLLSFALFLQLCEQTRAKGLHCPSPDPSKTTNGSYQLTPPCHPGERG